MPRRLPWLLLISAVIVFVDHLTKIWVAAHIPIGTHRTVIPGFFYISHWLNEGAAFSLFADSNAPHTVRWGLTAFSLLVALAVLAILVRLGSRITLTTVALSFVFGGALGNVHDRIAYGSVIDFIEVHIFTYHWPDFNVADSAIVTGACLLLLDSLFAHKSASPEPGPDAE